MSRKPKPPIPLHEFVKLDDDMMLKSNQFCSTTGTLSGFPLARSSWHTMVSDGLAPQGRKMPGHVHPLAPVYWSVRQVKEVVRKLETESGRKMPLYDDGEAACRAKSVT